jgi:glucose/arabinose dehydrogenase
MLSANHNRFKHSRLPLLTRWLWAATLCVALAGALRVGTQGAAPPILLVVNSLSANPYGPYLGEILKAEGLNSFSVAELSTLTSGTLFGAQVVVLAETTLSSAQALLLSNYVSAGGRLVVMRPDAQLLPVLGLSAEPSSTNEGYFAINQPSSFGNGFPSTTLPFHGQAQHYTPSTGAQVLSTVYSNATTATSFPAVVRYQNTVTWTYDLARSIVFTRQGFPANASDRDGQPPYRTVDIFFNAIDRDKVPIPYADVQMRMLARSIGDLLSDVMPVPRMWYFPGTNKTLVVLTADAHANPQSFYDTEIATVESYGGRISIYANGGSLSASTAASWRSRGHEVGMHPAGAQTGSTLTTAFQNNLAWFTSTLGFAPSTTTRTHQVEWQGWVDAAKVAANAGITLDTSYYTWGPAITYLDGRQAHGYINGSGQPMRFVDEAGVIVPVYQQVTSLIDEGLITTDFSEHLTPAAATAVSRQIIDNSQAGDYAAVTTQFHVDYFGFSDVRAWATATMDYARSLGIPMWTAERWANYTTARRGTTITNLSWSDASREMSFSVTVPVGSETQSVALPHHFSGFGLTNLTVDGSAVTGLQQQITGRATTFFSVTAGSHNVVAIYATPLPTVSLGVAPAVITQGQASTLSWNTANATSVSIDQGIGVVGASGTRTVSPLVSTTYNITATNSAGSVTTATTLTVIPPAPTVTASVSPTAIAAGDPATLTWSSTNAFTVTIDQGIGPVGLTGTRILSPSATTTYTVTATNVTGTATSTATLTVNPPPPGSSLRFNGTNQRARFTTLPAQPVFTVEGWVKRTADTGGWETFLSNVDPAYSQVSVNVYVDGGNIDCGGSPSDQFAWAYVRAGGWFIQCSGVSANLNAWHHIAVTRDSANVARIFIDGVLRGSASGTAAPVTSTGAFNIGTAGDSASEYFPGLLDEVRISNVARYTTNFTPQTARFATDSNTVALYHLDEGSGQTLADASGNNRNGFLGTSASTESSDPTWSTDVAFTGGPPVNVAPAITAQPSNQTVNAGQTATFTVAASGTPTPTYQWQVSTGGGPFTNLTNTAPYSGVTTTTLTITGVPAGLSGNQYRAVATNSVGSATSNAATLTVNVAPTFTSPPTNQTIVAGQNGSFTATVTGTPTPTLQWQVSTNGGGTFTNLANGAPYSGVTTSVLTLTGVPAGLNNNQYRLVATNSAGTATSAAATLTVSTAPTLPIITAQPTNQSAASGGNASFTVAATGSPAPTYQWQVSVGGGPFANLNAIAPYSGVTTTTLTITAVTAGLSGNQYRVVATNSAGSATSNAATLTVVSPPTFISETLITGLNEPTSVNFLPDGRMLILSRYGVIHQVQPGSSSVDPTPFMTLTNINTAEGERGLTGFALDPNFGTNRFFYLFYTANAPLRDRVSRFTMVGTTASPSSEFVVWQDDVASPLWHHGGSVLIGPDGKIYISTGDGFDRGNEVQPLTSFRGKMLRVNLDGTIPTDNPFYDGAGPNKDEIWARGLRNPFRMSFDPGTGDLYIGDVGANDPGTSIEEVNRWRAGSPAGLNFGWPICQGSCAMAGMTNPTFSYPHAGRDSSITAGFVYRGGNFGPAYEGSFFYGDYVQNWIKRLTFDASGAVTANLNFEPPNGASDGPYGEIVDVKQGPDGALYYVDIGISWELVLNPGTIRRIKNAAANLPPVITSVTYDPQSGATAPLTVNFQAAATDQENNPLTYSWVFGDGQTGSGATVAHTYAAKGAYIARLTVSDGTNQTLSEPLQVSVGTPPTVSITSPLNEGLFRAGDVITYAGTASDDDPLTAASYSWRIVMVHSSHTHPAAGPFTGTSGTFTVPTTGHELDASTGFQFILTVTDADGLQSSTAVLVRPDTVNLSFDTVPSGLTLLIDNLPRTAPITNFNIVKNFQLPVSVASPQSLSGSTYAFASWSDGLGQTHSITVPNVGQSYTATFTAVPPTSGFSLQFNGSTHRARFTSLPTMAAMTVEGWVKRTVDSGRYETFLSDASSNYGQETVGVFVDGGNSDCGSSPSDQFAWAYTKVGGGWFFQCSGVTADLNVWHHVAVTRDAAGTARIFVDGVLKATTTNAPPPTSTTGFFGIGEAGDAVTEHFSGRLDEIRISNIARYTGSFTPQTANFAPDANTVALYHLDEGAGQTLADSSGNNRSGFLGTSNTVEAVDPVWSSDSPLTGTPPPVLPTITFSVSPTAITSGNSATLTWTTANATDAAIDQGIGSVPIAGSRVVSPTTTATYTLTATNSNGSATATTTLTVNVAPVVTTQPTAQTVNAGQNVSFSVAASGTPTPTYQWQVSTGGGPFTNLTNTAPYGGVTTSTLTITAAPAGLSGNQYRAVATNSAGSATSNAVVLTVNATPAITTQPSNQTVNAGQTATFTVAASGTPTPTYQWQVSTGGGPFTNLTNTAPYSGVTTTTLTITGVTAGLSGNQYRAVATNSVGSATSNAATLTVNVAPTFTSPPTNQTIVAGQNGSFTATVTGTPTPTLQWQVSTNGGGTFTNLANGAPYSGVTTSVLTLTGVPAGLNNNQYRLVATNSAGTATSAAATLTVNTAAGAPVITTQPTNQTVTAGQNVSFTVAASGTPTPTYQWQVSIGGGPFTNLTNTAPYSGVTTTTLTITGATAGLSGNQYRAVATNSEGSATSNAAVLTVNTVPAITTQPANQTVNAGQTATFTVAASGTPTPTYQWQVSIGGGPFTNLTNTAPYSGVTTTTLTITGVTGGLSGNQYRAVATNSVGSATSNAATLTVNVAPTFTSQPTNQTVVAGQNGSFTATVTGTPTPTLQWQVSTNGGGTFTNLANGAPYSGVTTSVLTLTGVPAGLNSNQYRLVATNSAGTATSAAATLTVNVAPTITTQPTNQTVNSGQTAAFTAVAAGVPAPTYQWQLSTSGGPFTNLTNTAPYSGVTTSTLTITGATVGLSGSQYRVIVTNSVGMVSSNAATLTVNASAPGGSLSFNGSSQRARFTALPAMTVFTVEGWVKRTSDTGRYETFLSNANNGYNQETVGVYVDGGNSDCGSGDQFAWAYTRVGGGWFFQCSGVTAALNVWHHIAVTRDAANVTRIFINGVLRNTMTGTAAPTSSPGVFTMGMAADAATEFFPGLLDEVRISNVARYTASFTPQTTAFVTDANTVALYHLNEGTGQTLTDASGNNRNGVLGSSSTVEPVDAVRSTDSPLP